MLNVPLEGARLLVPGLPHDLMLTFSSLCRSRTKTTAKTMCPIRCRWQSGLLTILLHDQSYRLCRQAFIQVPMSVDTAKEWTTGDARSGQPLLDRPYWTRRTVAAVGKCDDLPRPLLVRLTVLDREHQSISGEPHVLHIYPHQFASP